MTASARAATWLSLAGVAVLAAAFLLVYYPTIQTLTEYWAANDTYSYGFLVPIISGYLIWLRRHVLRDLPRKPSFGLGTIVLFLGLLMLVVGEVSSTNLLQELSLPVSVFGVVLLVLGRRMTQSLTFPLAYLLTMIPFWDVLTGRLHQPFQLYSAVVGVGALRLLDIPVLRDGVFIYLPNITLEVADVCSGVNNLIAVLCIGVPLTHFYIKGWPRRGFIVSMAVLIALLSNGFRVAMVSLFAYYGIRSADGDIHGPFSLLRTLIISGVGFLVLFWLISRFADKPTASSATPESDSPSRSAPWVLSGAALALAISLLLGSIAFEWWNEVVPVPLTADLIGFPRVVGQWQVTRAGSQLRAFNEVGFDHTLARHYTAPDGAELELLLGYFERQQQGRELVGFQTSRLVSSKEESLTFPVGSGVRVNDYFTTRDDHLYYVTYWYVINGRVISERYQAKWLTTWNSLTRGTSNGALILVRTKLKGVEPIDATRERLRDFVQGVVTASGTYIPRG